MKKTIALAAAGTVAALALTGCSGKYTERYKDAGRGDSNTSPADVGTMPDGFSNYATKCDHGNRVYVLFHEDSSYGSIAVVPNAQDCQQ